uniref:Uncharacterized protein n=1 Tax=Arundo donax TaxID=35708 RepID=A0A0A9C5B6_ARUDO
MEDFFAIFFCFEDSPVVVTPCRSRRLLCTGKSSCRIHRGSPMHVKPQEQMARNPHRVAFMPLKDHRRPPR